MSSITGAYKVTSAMKLVSSVKLKTWRYRMLANKEYTEAITGRRCDFKRLTVPPVTGAINWMLEDER